MSPLAFFLQGQLGSWHRWVSHEFNCPPVTKIALIDCVVWWLHAVLFERICMHFPLPAGGGTWTFAGGGTWTFAETLLGAPETRRCPAAGGAPVLCRPRARRQDHNITAAERRIIPRRWAFHTWFGCLGRSSWSRSTSGPEENPPMEKMGGIDAPHCLEGHMFIWPACAWSVNVFCLSSPCKQGAYIVFVCIKGLVLIACAIILHRITSSSLSALLYLQTFVSLLVIIDFFSNTCPRNIDVYMLQRGRASEPTAKGTEEHVFVTNSRTCCACQPSKDFQHGTVQS